MRRIIINSGINAEPLAIMCAHIQNVQKHSIVITDETTFARYGEPISLNATYTAKDENKKEITLTEQAPYPNLTCVKFDDLIIAIYPSIIKVASAEEFVDVLETIEAFVAKSTLETIEDCTVYLSSLQIKDSLLDQATELTEGTKLNLNLFKTQQKISNEFVWTEAEDTNNVSTAVTGNYFEYTCIYNKKLHKKAAALKKEVVLITPKDLIAAIEAEMTGKCKATGIFRSIATEICKKHLSITGKSINAWLDRDYKR